MIISNHVLTVDGLDIDLPRLAVPATVRVWRVPASYRPTGVFVSVTPVGEPSEVPACDLSICEFLGKMELAPHPDAQLADAKARKKAQIESERDAALQAPAMAHGREWDADMRSQELLARAIALAQATGVLPPVWRDRSNADMPVTSLDDLAAIATVIATQVQTAYQASWARKAAVDAATTIEEVDAA